MEIENRKLSEKLIDSIEQLRKAINEISVYDLNTYTAIELYYKIANKINEIIQECYRYEIAVSEEIVNQNDCLQYLLNSGLQIEVIKKINEMVKDGTMDTIINQNVLQSITNQIDPDVVKVHFIKRDNSKADCMLIETKNNNTIIDVGWETNSANLVNYLNSKGINHIDNIIISHYHDDHIGGITGQGFISFLNSTIDFTGCNVYLPHPSMDYSRLIDTVNNGIAKTISTAEITIKNAINEKGLNIIYPTENQTINLNTRTTLRFMNVDNAFISQYYSYTMDNIDNDKGFTSYNNFSIVCELVHMRKKFLFTGDIELPAQELLINSVSENIDVYKVEHHGVNRSTNKNFLYKVNPKFAVVQNRSKIGLKDRMTLTYLFNKGTKIYDNNTSGDVIFTSNGSDIKVEADTESKIDIGFNYCGQPYDLKRGLSIKENEDLNNYIDIGVFYCETSSICNSLTNKPDNIASGGFRLIVCARQTDTTPIQTIIDANGDIFTRLYKNDKFSDWGQLDLKNKSFITAKMTSSHTTTTSELEQLEIDTNVTSTGKGLTLTNNSIVVGKNINKVRVSGQIGFSNDGSSPQGFSKIIEGYICVNNKNVIRNGCIQGMTYSTVNLGAKIIPVKEGDIITIKGRTRNYTGGTISSNDELTYLTVEVV